MGGVLIFSGTVIQWIVTLCTVYCKHNKLTLCLSRLNMVTWDLQTEKSYMRFITLFFFKKSNYFCYYYQI